MQCSCSSGDRLDAVLLGDLVHLVLDVVEQRSFGGLLVPARLHHHVDRRRRVHRRLHSFSCTAYLYHLMCTDYALKRLYSPFWMHCTATLLFISGYGIRPSAKISQIRMPKLHTSDCVLYMP